MDHIEMVENLRQKANVSYSEAKESLEKANWDMLEAMILLENDGKIEKGTSSSSSKENEKKYEVVAATASVKNDHNEKVKKNMKSFFGRVFRILIDNSLIVRRKESEIITMPLLVFALFCCSDIRFILVLILVGLFLGCGYYIEGSNFSGNSKVNQVMNDVNNSFDHMMNNEKKDD